MDDVVVGVFYIDKVYHWAKYTPYRSPPDRTLCGIQRTVWAAGVPLPTDKRCEKCEELLNET